MQKIIKNLIPGSIDEVIDKWRQEDSEKYRLTLLHKNKNDYYCFLSNNMQEIESNNEISMGMTIVAKPKRVNVKVHYDLVFSKKDLNEGFYFVMSEESLFERENKVIPFYFKSDLLSTIVERQLKEKLLDYIEIKSRGTITNFEYLGSHTFIKTFLHVLFSKEVKEKRKIYRAASKSLGNDISSLFHEEKSPSDFIQQFDYLSEDKKKKTLFVNSLKNILTPMSFIPLSSFLPYSMCKYYISQAVIKPYENKFGQNKEEEAKALSSEFFAGHPRVVEGFTKILEVIKHTGNITAYAMLGGATAFSHFILDSPVLSYPLITGMGLSGLTMLTNFIKSKGRNSSGMISTVLDIMLYNKLK